jgi:uncharacterized alpha-E superfamily protein
MLSRTASSLYWIGRHIERADFTARLIDAGLKFDMLPFSDSPSGIQSAFEASGATLIYPSDKAKAKRKQIINFMCFDESNPSSVISCFGKARHDARAVRTALTREVFEELNEAWLNFKKIQNAVKNDDFGTFVSWVEDVVRGFEGALHRTMLRNECLWFIRLGAAVERADNTARLLDVKYHVLLPSKEHIGGPIDQAQWTALLRSVSAETAYRWLYREGLVAWDVAELLILKQEMPRSLAACIAEINLILSRLRSSNGRTGAADRKARAIENNIKNNNINTIFQSGLHEFLVQFQADNNSLGHSIAEQFLF